jgi:hypothetical protein
VTLWSSVFLLVVIVFGVQQEWLNHRFATPEEWSWYSKIEFRNACWEGDVDEQRNGLVDWAFVGMTYVRIVKRLEDPAIDGAGLKDQDEGGILVEGIGKMGYDITSKSEPWRRGYYEVLMGLGKSAEHLDGWVMDRNTKTFFPANVVIGPSNPNPKPVPAGAKPAPREEDCEIAFEGPATYYMRILTTKGFTDKQKVDAALAYATFLDFKRTPEAAYEVYKWALDIATSKAESKQVVDPTTHVLRPEAGLPSENILAATTALAVHEASNNKLSTALPIFLSVLRARRSLPEAPPTMLSALISDEEQKAGPFGEIIDFFKKMFRPPRYPPPPPDGNSPPNRTAKQTCEEAGVMTYIGEILYASQSGTSSKEDGLAWTREAVDIAEEQLRRRGGDRLTKKTCVQCLQTGMGNWEIMVKQFAKLEQEKKKENSTGWLGFGSKSPEELRAKGRWESEESVVEERAKRVKDILREVKAPGTSLMR